MFGKMATSTYLSFISVLVLCKECAGALCPSNRGESVLPQLRYCTYGCCGPDRLSCCVISSSAIIGITVACASLILILIGLGSYLFIRRRTKMLSVSEKRRTLPRSASSFAFDLNLDAEVRRPSLLSVASLPSSVYHIPKKYRQGLNAPSNNMIQNKNPGKSTLDEGIVMKI